MEGITCRNASAASSQPCAQRLSASWKESLPFAFIDRVFAVCSTPFGVMEGITRSNPTGHVAVYRCSTPFGVMEGITGSCSASSLRQWSAQRLSASWKESQHLRLNRRRLPRCSTPFGVMEGITQNSTNASTPPSCAQRLSASWKESRFRSSTL